MQRDWAKSTAFYLLGLICVFLTAGTAVLFHRVSARETSLPVGQIMLDSIRAPSGLCVHLGLRDPELTMALADDGRYLVHGWTPDGKAVARLREVVRSKKLEGIVSAEQGALARLPYADNLANLVIAERAGELAGEGLAWQELLRILSPEGFAFLGVAPDAQAGQDAQADKLEQQLREAGADVVQRIEADGVWLKVSKPRPDGMDVWSHRRYDSGGTAVSKETHVGVPSGLRWVAGPNWATGLRYSAVQAVTTTERQLVYFFDDEIDTPEGPKSRYSLVGRDAYNGLLLWKRPVDDQRARAQLLVTQGRRAYTRLRDDDPLVAVDTATGKTVKVYDEAGQPNEVLLVDGVLIVAAGSGEVRALDARTGQRLWKNEKAGTNLLAGDGKLFFRTSGRREDGNREMVLGSLDLQTGKELWRAGTFDWAPQATNPVFYADGVIVIGGRKATHAASAKDGSHLWTHTYPLIGHGGSYAKVLYQDALVWVHPAATAGKKQYAWEGLDPQTGEVKKRHWQPADFAMKHRCFEDRGTARKILCGTMDFVDLESGEYEHFAAARHSCRDGGVMPGNGMLYTFPHACHCYPMLRGFMGLVSEDAKTVPSTPDPFEERLVTWPALQEMKAEPAEPVASAGPNRRDWPTLRGHARRHSSTEAPGPVRIGEIWQQQVAQVVEEFPEEGRPTFEWKYKAGGRLSSPVIAGGRAFAASIDEHRLNAYDAETGRPLWSFTAGGRIDAPPTIHGQLCLLGARDGQVYCLRAEDGELLWRFRAAPTPERILAYGQLESLWPVVGGVLVYDGLAYVTAGRHSHADQGIHVYALRPQTGELVWHNQPQSFRGVADLLVGDGDAVRLISAPFHPATGDHSDGSSAAALRAGRLGLASDEWYRHPIALRKHQQKWSVKGETAQLLAFNERMLCGFMAGDDKQSGAFLRGLEPLAGPARLFAKSLDPDSDSSSWTLDELPRFSQVKGMVLTRDDRLLIAGRLGGDDPQSQAVRAYSTQDGSRLESYPLPAPPVFEGLAVAGRRIYVSLEDGTLRSLGSTK